MGFVFRHIEFLILWREHKTPSILYVKPKSNRNEWWWIGLRMGCNESGVGFITDKIVILKNRNASRASTSIYSGSSTYVPVKSAKATLRLCFAYSMAFGLQINRSRIKCEMRALEYFWFLLFLFRWCCALSDAKSNLALCTACVYFTMEPKIVSQFSIVPSLLDYHLSYFPKNPHRFNQLELIPTYVKIIPYF